MFVNRTIAERTELGPSLYAALLIWVVQKVFYRLTPPTPKAQFRIRIMLLGVRTFSLEKNKIKYESMPMVLPLLPFENIATQNVH